MNLLGVSRKSPTQDLEKVKLPFAIVAIERSGSFGDGGSLHCFVRNRAKGFPSGYCNQLYSDHVMPWEGPSTQCS